VGYNEGIEPGLFQFGGCGSQDLHCSDSRSEQNAYTSIYLVGLEYGFDIMSSNFSFNVLLFVCVLGVAAKLCYMFFFRCSYKLFVFSLCFLIWLAETGELPS
jgi:hypothetical protein